MIITGPQCRAARSLVEWSLDQLARESHLAPDTINAFEQKIHDPGTAVKRRLLEVLESAGAVFIWENGGGVGVRLKYTHRDVRAVNKWEGEGGPAGEDDV